MTTSFVTGGAGFIGSHLVEALLREGRRVVVLDDFSTGRLENLAAVTGHSHLQVIEGDVCDRKLIGQLIAKADEVYHLAAVVGVRLVLEEPDRTVAVNSEATAMLLKLLSTCPRPLFLASTSEVYGKNPRTPLNEEDDSVLGPSSKTRWIYALGKAMDDQLALSYHRRCALPVVVGRFFNTVGPRQTGRYGMVIPRFVDQALKGGPLQVHGDGQQVRCFAHVADVVRGMLGLMACRKAVGKVFNLGNDEATTINGLAERIVRLANPHAEIQHIPYCDVFGEDFEDIRRRVPDLTRIREAIGYNPAYRLDDILGDVIAWKRRNRATTHAESVAILVPPARK